MIVARRKASHCDEHAAVDVHYLILSRARDFENPRCTVCVEKERPFCVINYTVR